MNYKLDNKPLSYFGAVPIQNKGILALDGVFDLPKRVGKTEYDWGTHIEPFLDAYDIEFDKRTLSFNVAVKDEGNKVNSFINSCIDCRVFSCDLDSWNVLCVDEIKLTKVVPYQQVEVEFIQPELQLKSLTVIPSISGLWRLDNYNLVKDFGIYISENTDFRNVAKRIEVNTTEMYRNTQYRGINSVDVKCFMKGNSTADLYQKINQFWSLCMKPGKRQFTTPFFSKSIYIKDGANVDMPHRNILTFTLKICYE